MIALVFSEIAALDRLGSMLYVGICTSTKTGTMPHSRIGLTVVGNPAATEMIHRPALLRVAPSCGDVSAENAINGR